MINFRLISVLLLSLLLIAGCQKQSNGAKKGPSGKITPKTQPKIQPKTPTSTDPPSKGATNADPVKETPKGGEAVVLPPGPIPKFSGKPARAFVAAEDTPAPAGMGKNDTKKQLLQWIKQLRKKYLTKGTPHSLLTEDVLINEIAAFKNSTDNTMRPSTAMEALLPELKGENVIEVGAGVGKLMGYWTDIREVRHALMVDLDPVAIDLMAYRATRESPLIDHRKRFFFLQESYENSHLPADWASLIIFLNGHQWIMRTQEEIHVMKRYWSGVAKALKKGGRLVISDLCSRERNSCLPAEKMKEKTAIPTVAKVSGMKLVKFEIDKPRAGQWTAILERE